MVLESIASLQKYKDSLPAMPLPMLMLLLLLSLLLLYSTPAMALFGWSAKETSYSEAFTSLALDLEESFEANFALGIKNKKDKEERRKFSNYTKLYPLVDSARGKGEKNVQADLDQLAQVYQALNYADMAALQLLRRSCLDDGLFHPKTDPVLCKSYPKQVINSIESRIGMINSYTLYSDELVRPPRGWIEHAREILRLLEADKNGNVRAYVLQNMLLKAFKDYAEGRATEYDVPQPPDSPLPFISNTPRMIYTPGMQMSMPVTIAPQPYLSDAPPVVAPSGPGSAYPTNSAPGQPIQMFNGQAGAPGASAGAAPCRGNSNVIAIPVMPITALSRGTPIMGIDMNVPQAKALNARSSEACPEGTEEAESVGNSSTIGSSVGDSSTAATGAKSAPKTATEKKKEKSSWFPSWSRSKPKPEAAQSTTSTTPPAPPKKSFFSGLFGKRNEQKAVAELSGN